MVRQMARTGRIGRLTGGLLTVALLVAVAGCGSDNKGGGQNTSTPTATATAVPSAAAPSSAAEQQVRDNWEKFFSPDTPVKDKAKLLQNGDQLQLVLQAFAGDSRVGKVKAKVSKVEFTSATEATVTYTLSLSGQNVLTDATGTSVLQNKVWKVSVKSLCGLIAMDSSSGTGGSVPGC
ncbi:MAG: hypothetical protein QOF84_7367 [Streptomyces sp.]|nr:hypothetical protein [Streptomyces sp.]MDX6352577.1 hypothetical protein [Streptomyces sp.]